MSIHQPSARLQPWIENYMKVDIEWSNQKLDRKWRLVPYGKPSVIFLTGDAHYFNIAGKAPELTTPAFLTGQMKAPIQLQFGGHTKMIKVQFKPAGLRQFMKYDISEFTNNASIPLDLIWGSTAYSISEQLEAFPRATATILDRFFEEKLLQPLQQTSYVHAAIEQFERFMGNISMQELLSTLYISGRHLERIFRSIVGLTPNDYKKLVRLNYAFKYLEKNPGTSFTDLSHRAGYYDQAHFTHEFKRFAGSAPTKIRSLKNELLVTGGKCFINRCLTAS